MGADPMEMRRIHLQDVLGTLPVEHDGDMLVQLFRAAAFRTFQRRKLSIPHFSVQSGNTPRFSAQNISIPFKKSKRVSRQLSLACVSARQLSSALLNSRQLS